MTDYKKLVEALRCKVGITEEETKCEKCPYGTGYSDCDVERYCNDAADAIEALQAENPIVESVLVDKMRQQMEETACHCNVKENAELIARILDDDVDGKVFELPKRGKWIWENYCWHCSVCGENPTRGMGYVQGKSELFRVCPNCGAKMEVQE